MGTRTPLTTIAAVVLTVALAAPAAAQTVSTTATAKQFAQELFGQNSGSIKLNVGSVVRIAYPSGTDVVANGQYAVFTFRFNGAKLAEPISSGDFALYNSGGTRLDTLFVISEGEEGGGGQKGDDFVSYRVTSAPTVSSIIATNRFDFIVPDLDTVTVANEQSADARKITVDVTVTPPPGSRFGLAANNFPKYPADGAAANSNRLDIAVINPAYSITTVPPSTSTEAHRGEITLDNPRSLTATSTSPLLDVTGFGDTTRKGIRISTATITEESGSQYQADGTTLFAVGVTDMFTVVARGNFAPSDRLFFSSTAVSSGNISYRENSDLLLTISGDGTSARGSIPLSGTGAISTADDHALYYVPAGEQAIRRGSIGSEYTLDFAAATARDTDVAAKDLTLEYSGINYTNYAYAIPSTNAADAANLRVRCEGASACTAFFRCTDQQGMEIGSFPRMNIEAGSIAHVTSMELAEMLGVEDWSGRLSCSIHSSSRLAVQLLVRSGGTLTNNTFIGGLEPMEPAQ